MISNFKFQISIPCVWYNNGSQFPYLCVGMSVMAGEKEWQTPKLKNSICGVASFALNIKLILNFNLLCLFYGFQFPYLPLCVQAWELQRREREGQTPKLKNSICGVASFALNIMIISNFNPLCLFYGSQFPYLPPWVCIGMSIYGVGRERAANAQVKELYLWSCKFRIKLYQDFDFQFLLFRVPNFPAFFNPMFGEIEEYIQIHSYESHGGKKSGKRPLEGL